MNLLISISIAMAVLLLFIVAIIVLYVLYPNNRQLKAINEWQSLIGSLVGFIAIAYALFAGDQLNEWRDSTKALRSEVVLIEGVERELVRSTHRINAWLSELKENPISDPYECTNLIEAIKSANLVHFNALNRIDEFAGVVSTETYLLLSDAKNAAGSHWDSIKFIGSIECAGNFKNSAKTVTEGLNMSVSRLETIINEIRLRVAELASVN